MILNGKNHQLLDKDLLHAHVKHLKSLAGKGNLLVCGPFANDSDAMLVLEATDVDDAERMIIKDDPFIKGNFYGNHSVIEFYKAEESNGYLMKYEQTI